MRIKIIAVGKAKDRDLRSLLGDYYARIGRYAKLEEIEIKDGKADDVAERLSRTIPIVRAWWHSKSTVEASPAESSRSGWAVPKTSRSKLWFS